MGRHGTFYIMHKDWERFVVLCKVRGYSYKIRPDKWNIADLATIVTMTNSDYLSVSRQLDKE